MANHRSAVFAETDEIQPAIRDINTHDLIDALRKGFDDFMACPSHLVLLALIYPIVGLVLARLSFGYDMLPVVFPMISGFALIGPLAAVGLYEMSRRREQGAEISLKNAFDVFSSHSIVSVLALGLIQLAIYIAWLTTALIIYNVTFGEILYESIPEFFDLILTTPAGWTLIIVGCGVGFVFALMVLTISVVSFPMLLDRDVGVVHAVQTSIRAVLANPMTMAAWGIIVASLLVIGIVPLFVGLTVIMPVLGHATWHLYRKVVAY